MSRFERYLRRCSKMLNGRTKSVRVYDGNVLLAVVMNQDRYHAASYSQMTDARKRVYRKTHDELSVRSTSVSISDDIDRDEVEKIFGEKLNFKPIFFQKGRYGKTAVCISPKTFRLFSKTAAIKMTLKKLDAHINELPVYRKGGELFVSGAWKRYEHG